MPTDTELRQDIAEELAWEPSIDASELDIAVHDGVVNLRGLLNSYAERDAVERMVQRVHGVKALVLEVEVRLDPANRRSDAEIAAAAEAALQWHVQVPAERITVEVRDGWITLRGEVDWDFQRRSAEKTLRNLKGVTGLRNQITLKARPVPDNVADRIREAFQRHAEREARHIEVDVDDGVVTLRGMVGSWAQRKAAFGAAWAAPGVSRVVNDLRVGD